MAHFRCLRWLHHVMITTGIQNQSLFTCHVLEYGVSVAHDSKYDSSSRRADVSGSGPAAVSARGSVWALPLTEILFCCDYERIRSKAIARKVGRVGHNVVEGEIVSDAHALGWRGGGDRGKVGRSTYQTPAPPCCRLPDTTLKLIEQRRVMAISQPCQPI